MTPPRLVLALAFVVVAASIGVGAASPAPTPSPTPEEADGDAPPMGVQVSSFMQSSASQADGAVDNGMWIAAFANASDEATQRALVEDRVVAINTTISELRAERQALQEAYRNGSIDRVTYQARLSTIVGQLAALGESIDDAGERGQAVGVNRTRLDQLRSQARELGGGEVSALARNLTGGHGPPGAPGIFDDGKPGPPDDRGPDNRSTSAGRGDGGDGKDSETRGPPTDRGNGPKGQGQGGPPAGDATPTPTPTE